MRRLNRSVAVLLASAASLLLAYSIALAQPAPQGTAESQTYGMSGGQGSMTGGGMGMGRMKGMEGMGGMGMGCMGGMGMMQMMQKDPKLMGRMMELRGEMMRMMGDAMIQHGKELQEGK